MPIAAVGPRYTHIRCLRAPRNTRYSAPSCRRRTFTTSTRVRHNGSDRLKTQTQSEGEQSALSRRLAQMTEDSLESGAASARKAVEEAGFDGDLKRRLEERIASASFRNEHASALAQVELPASAGRGTRDIAGAQPWTGSESVEDASLRMLNDAHKPMRGPAKIPVPCGTPVRVDAGRPRSKPSSGARLANARDRSSIYATMKDIGMSEEEKEQYHKEVKARFAPGARSIPGTIQGLTSLANERIEDAIARGQFKNIPRGKRIERDYNASSPFLDTTEYFLNKIIQKQEIVPPWIEKQQELVSAATKFRARLRSDWRRHAARMIASNGGSLDDQIRRAQEHAAAEAIENPPRRKEETLNAVDSKDHISQITLAGELKPTSDPYHSGTATEAQINIQETRVSESGSTLAPAMTEITVTQRHSPSTPTVQSSLGLFRDPTWEATERSYHDLTIANLNSLTRSYNLIAPQLAQKPYFSLERELKACYAEVAPLVPGEIRERAMRPKVKVEIIRHRPGSLLEKTFDVQKTRVYDENLKVKGYGFKQFWQDLWRRNDVT